MGKVAKGGRATNVIRMVVFALEEGPLMARQTYEIQARHVELGREGEAPVTN